MMNVVLRIQIIRRVGWHHLDHALRDRQRSSLRLAGGNALTKVDGIPGDDVLIHIAALENKIKSELEFAWNHNISINDYFLTLIPY